MRLEAMRSVPPSTRLHLDNRCVGHARWVHESTWRLHFPSQHIEGQRVIHHDEFELLEIKFTTLVARARTLSC